MASCPKKYIMNAIEDPEEQDRLNHLHDSIGEQALETKNYRRVADNIQAIGSKYVEAMKFLSEMREKYAPGVVKLARQGNRLLLEVDVSPLIPKQLELPLKQEEKTEEPIPEQNIVDKILSLSTQEIHDRIAECK